MQSARIADTMLEGPQLRVAFQISSVPMQSGHVALVWPGDTESHLFPGSKLAPCKPDRLTITHLRTDKICSTRSIESTMPQVKFLLHCRRCTICPHISPLMPRNWMRFYLFYPRLLTNTQVILDHRMSGAGKMVLNIHVLAS